MTEPKITQADRDAARAAQVDMLIGGAQGDTDVWRKVEEAFARHRIAAEEGLAELVEAAEALRDDMLERARIAALLRKDAAVIVEAGNGVWLRFDGAIASVRGEG